MDQLADSTSLIGHRDALPGRLAADGYLFFRGLLPAAEVRSTGTAILGRLEAGGWSPGPIGPQAVTVREALADPAFRAAVVSPEFNRLPYLPPLRTLMRQILGPQAFSYPVKVLRVVRPEPPASPGGLRWPWRRAAPGGAGPRPDRPRGRYVHYDYGVSGVQDMLTTWLPLMDIPVRLGGLGVRPRGHLGPPRLPRLLGRDEPGWATAGYHPGDVIVFHCLTPHAALANTGAELRLSADFRWQRADQVAPTELVLGPVGLAGRARAGAPAEAFGRLLQREPWWEPVPAGLTLGRRADLVTDPPGPSRFFPVHPGWRAWQPPPGAVH
ncbi:MAG TPA: phytanoyl-CoA dioxygenase family protein [Streptosporangiaceae bacterium]|nr:phytanoyl-CoA dioxygenase family protein [Streptosporangiaceae bacterium]